MNLALLMDLLCDAHLRASIAQPERVVSLTLHLAERGGRTIAAAVLEAHEVTVSDEWIAA